MQVGRQAQVDLRLRRGGRQLVELLDGLLADVVELGDGVVQRRDLLLLQVLGALGDHLEATVQAALQQRV